MSPLKIRNLFFFRLSLIPRVIFAAALWLIFGGRTTDAQAGYWEISANGSYFKQANGYTALEYSYSISQRAGAGIAYRLLSSTALELNYSYSRSFEHYAYVQPFSGYQARTVLDRTSDSNNLSLDLILEFADGKKARFRPFIEGGLGISTQRDKTTGASTNSINSDVAPISQISPTTKSLSANGGLGFKIFVAESVAIEFSGKVYASELDKPEIFLHYALTGGMRFLF